MKQIQKPSGRRYLFGGAISILATCLFVIGCNRPAPEATESAPPTVENSLAPGVAGIRADPNPVPPGDGAGKTTITWKTGDASVGEVYVWDGTIEKLFVRGTDGSSEAPWISDDANFEFRLYSATDHSKILARVKVTRQHH